MNKDAKTDKNLKKWISYQSTENTYCFSFFQIVENKVPDDDIVRLLQESILFSYRQKEFYHFHLGETATEEEVRQYVKDQIIPDDKNQFDRNVRQGDWGEVLSGLIVTYFQNRKIPINKLQWKLNKNKSVFGTDLIAFNEGEKINDIYYYEIKTRLHPDKTEGRKTDKQYISIWAYRSLKKDADSPTESIANFLESYYFDKNDYDNASKFKDIVVNPQNYNNVYEIFLIVEKMKFDVVILDALNDLPPELSPLNVTIVLIENMKFLVDKTWEDIGSVLVNHLIKGESL